MFAASETDAPFANVIVQYTRRFKYVERIVHRDYFDAFQSFRWTFLPLVNDVLDIDENMLDFVIESNERHLSLYPQWSSAYDGLAILRRMYERIQVPPSLDEFNEYMELTAMFWRYSDDIIEDSIEMFGRWRSAHAAAFEAQMAPATSTAEDWEQLPVRETSDADFVMPDYIINAYAPTA